MSLPVFSIFTHIQGRRLAERVSRSIKCAFGENMPVVTQLLTDSERSLLSSILPEKSFFELGNPYAITLLQRDIEMARRLKQLSPRFRSNGNNGTGRGRMVAQLSQEFGLCIRMVYRILMRLEGRSNGHRRRLKLYVTDFAAVQG